MPIIIDVFPFFTTLTLLNFNINFSNGEFPLAVEKCYQTSTSFRQVLKKTDFYNFRGKDGSTIYYIQWDIIQSLDFSWKSCHGYFVFTMNCIRQRKVSTSSQYTFNFLTFSHKSCPIPLWSCHITYYHVLYYLGSVAKSK